MTLRVLIADDHVATRLAVRLALEEAGLTVCAEAGTAQAATSLAHEHLPDVALLDVRMPGGGIDAAASISSDLPGVAVVMLTVSRDDRDLFDALRAGARGYLLKDTDPDRLALALQGVLDGEAALPRGLVARLIDEFRDREHFGRRPGGALAKLTVREWEVLDLMRAGATTREIARRLFVSPVTVRTHVSAILRKLRVPDRDAAVRLVETRSVASEALAPLDVGTRSGRV